MRFQLDAFEVEKLNLFRREQYAKLVAAQKGTPDEKWHHTDDDGVTYPYMGAIGGGFTFEFTPTGLGTIARVIFCKGVPGFEASIDLTDYESW